jgi:hypothetical protein
MHSSHAPTNPLTRQLKLVKLLASGAFAEVYEVETIDERKQRLAAKVRDQTRVCVQCMCLLMDMHLHARGGDWCVDTTCSARHSRV